MEKTGLRPESEGCMRVSRSIFKLNVARGCPGVLGVLGVLEVLGVEGF